MIRGIEMATSGRQELIIGRQRPLADIESDLALAARLSRGDPVRRVFLADGDAMGQSTKRLTSILERIREALPSVSRVSSYCLPRNVRGKSVEDLAALSRTICGSVALGNAITLFAVIGACIVAAIVGI